MNVLLIEDDKRIAGPVERSLKENGHRVSISHNGTEGARLMLEETYDAALLDILLPGIGGQMAEAVLSSRPAHRSEASPVYGSDSGAGGRRCCFPQAYSTAPR